LQKRAGNANEHALSGSLALNVCALAEMRESVEDLLEEKRRKEP